MSSKNSLFLTTWPKKRTPPKHYKIGVSANQFLKNRLRQKTAIFGQKHIQKFQLSFFAFLPFSISFNDKKPQKLLKPNFYSALANIRKRIFINQNLKQRNLKNAPFLKPKNVFRKLQDIWAQKSHKMITECAKQIA